MFKIRSVLFLVVLVASSQAFAEIKGPVIYAAVHYPPLWVVDKQKVTGLQKDVTDRLSEVTGINIQVKAIPYSRTKILLPKGDIALLPVAYTLDQAHIKDSFIYPIPDIILTINTYSKGNLPANFKKPEDFTNKSVIVVRGWPLGTFDALLDKSINLKLYKTNSVEGAVGMFLANRADYLVLYKDPYNRLKEQHPKPNDFKDVKTNFLINLYTNTWAIPKSYPYKDELYQKLQEGYLKIQDELEPSLLTLKQ